MKPIKVPRIPILFRVFDYAMIPLMFFLGGLKKDSVQETHPWHCFRGFDVEAINKGLAITNVGSDSNSFKRHFLFLFHAPIFGGWKDYIVLKPREKTNFFYIGWICYDTKTKSLTDFAISKLPVTNGSIRMLSGAPNRYVYFFALNKEGVQIALKIDANGRLGDYKYPGVRLF